jgi:hypothetical protein
MSVAPIPSVGEQEFEPLGTFRQVGLARLLEFRFVLVKQQNPISMNLFCR